MPKRRSDGRGGGRTARRHLYLVLDDWYMGYSIRKVDLSSDFDCDDSGQLIAAGVPGKGSVTSVGEQLLPSPIFCINAQRGLPMYFAAFGTKVMAMHPREDGDEADTSPLVHKRLITCFNVRTRAMVFCPRPKEDQSYPLYIPVGNRLFALSGSFQLLNPQLAKDQSGRWCAKSWCKLAEPPFDSRCVTSYAVHPDGQTIFVSVGRFTNKKGTFSIHMVEDMEKGIWEPLGEWILPFNGCGHFDRKLDAWVGLSTYPDPIGHLCSCDVIAPTASNGQCPTRKVSKETLFSQDQNERHIGATLIHMGHSSEYCLVQCTCIDDKHPVGKIYKYRDEGRLPCRYLFRVTTFSLKYEGNGDLTACHSRPVRYFNVPGEASMLLLHRPVAFWM
ncbi:unnamed protein product [Alopecurus aequalis]